MFTFMWPKELLKNIDAKTITSVGGIILAAFLCYVLWDIAGQKIDGISQALAEFSTGDLKSKDNLANALLQNAKALEGNTKVMEQVLRQQK